MPSTNSLLDTSCKNMDDDDGVASGDDDYDDGANSNG